MDEGREYRGVSCSPLVPFGMFQQHLPGLHSAFSKVGLNNKIWGFRSPKEQRPPLIGGTPKYSYKKLYKRSPKRSGDQMRPGGSTEGRRGKEPEAHAHGEHSVMVKG